MKNQSLLQELKELKQKINTLQENDSMFSREDISKYSPDELFLRISNEPTFKYELEAFEKAVKMLQTKIEQKYKANHQQIENLYNRLAQTSLHLK